METRELMAKLDRDEFFAQAKVTKYKNPVLMEKDEFFYEISDRIPVQTVAIIALTIAIVPLIMIIDIELLTKIGLLVLLFGALVGAVSAINSDSLTAIYYTYEVSVSKEVFFFADIPDECEDEELIKDFLYQEYEEAYEDYLFKNKEMDNVSNLFGHK